VGHRLAEVEKFLSLGSPTFTEIRPEHLNEQTGGVTPLRIPMSHRLATVSRRLVPDGSEADDATELLDHIAIRHP
jgi:hypothetical protein